MSIIWTRSSWLAALLTLGLALACTDANKVPAEAALQTAEAAVASLGDVGMKYVPEQTQELQRSLAGAKELAARKDYKGALAAAAPIPDRAKQVLAAANAKQDELHKHEALTRTFRELSAPIPNMLAMLKSRLEILSQSKKLPAGMTKASLEVVQAGTAELESRLGAMQAQAKGGDLEGAIAKAGELNAKGTELLRSIGMAQ